MIALLLILVFQSHASMIRICLSDVELQDMLPQKLST